ncbi:hypothetical protein DMA11_15845 [Marinilabiliaceae bacterium JC017]|nr:hypothetical protein DMA11_15845 [Marinilabiliaceae bacterium JC017]
MIIYPDTKLVRKDHEKHSMILHLEYETSEKGEIAGQFECYSKTLLVAPAPDKPVSNKCTFKLKGEIVNERIKEEIVFNYESKLPNPTDQTEHFDLNLIGSDDDESTTMLSARVHF